MINAASFKFLIFLLYLTVIFNQKKKSANISLCKHMQYFSYYWFQTNVKWKALFQVEHNIRNIPVKILIKLKVFNIFLHSTFVIYSKGFELHVNEMIHNVFLMMIYYV